MAEQQRLYHLYHEIDYESDTRIASYTCKEKALAALLLYRNFLDNQTNSSSYNKDTWKNQDQDSDSWIRGDHTVYLQEDIVDPIWDLLGFNR